MQQSATHALLSKNKLLLCVKLTHWHPLRPHAPGNIIPLKFQCALMRPVRHGTLWLAVAKKPYSPENWNLVKRDLNKLSFIWDQTRKNTFYLRFFTNFWKQQFSSRHGFWSIWWFSRFIRWRRRFLCRFYSWRNRPNEARSPKAARARITSRCGWRDWRSHRPRTSGKR